MTNISNLIIDNQKKMAEAEAEKRAQHIKDTQAKIFELLKSEGFSVQDASIVLKFTQDQMMNKVSARPLSELV